VALLPLALAALLAGCTVTASTSSGNNQSPGATPTSTLPGAPQTSNATPTATPAPPPPTATGTPIHIVCCIHIPPSVHQVLSQQTLNGSGAGFVSVGCPAGEVALAGGYASNSSQAFVSTSDRGSPASNGWLLEVNHSTTTLVNVYVECLQNAPGATVTQRLADVSVPANSYANGYASCNPGEVLVGGGFTGVSGPTGIEIYNFMANGAMQWGGYAQNHTAFPGSITFYAECLTYSSAHSSFTLPPRQYAIGTGASGAGNSPTCASGMYVSGGGFADDSFGTLYTMFVNGSSWQVALQSSPGHANLLNAYAMCLGF
jgi:hypothetical protein